MKKLFLIIFIGLLLINIVSALEFDNVKSYDPITREVKIINAYGLGDEIGKARLNTPLNVYVGQGYQKVAEFDLWAYQDYNDALKQFEFKDMKNGKEKINREYDLKYKSYENVKIDDYDNVLIGYYENGTAIYEYQKIGEHYEKKEVWIKVSPADLKKNDFLTIGVFTNVQEGDYVDWIPMIYGVQVEEWATWTEDLNTNMHFYYSLNETSGTVVIDSHHNLNSTNTGATVGVTGKIDFGYNFSQIDNDYFKTDSNIGITGTDSFSVNMWFKMNSDPSGGQYDALFTLGNVGSNTVFGILRHLTNANSLHFSNWGPNDLEIPTGETLLNNWHMMTCTYDGSTVRVYINGRNLVNHSHTAGITDNDFYVGQMAGNNNFWLDANIDEVTLWKDRVLSTDDIHTIYDLQSNGIGYNSTNGTADNPPVIILNSPTSDTNYTTLQNITFNFTAYDDINLTDVKLYVNDVLNQTNASGINNTDYLFTLNLNDGDYTIYGKATDNESQSTNSNSVRIVINTTPFIEYLTPPTLVNNSNITQENIPISVNVSTSYFKNITYYLENDDNGTLYTQFYENETYNINFTNFPDAHYDYNVTICTTTNKCNSTETRHLNHDATPPTIFIFDPVGTKNYFLMGNNESLNYTVNDSSINSCWYDYYNGNIGFLNKSNLPTNLTDNNLTSWSLPSGNNTLTVYDDINEIVLSTYDADAASTLSYNTINVSSCPLINEQKIININSSTSFIDNLWYVNFSCGSTSLLNKSYSNFGVGFLPKPSEIYVNKTYLNCNQNLTNFTYINGKNNLTLYADDTFGSKSQNFTSWDYKIIENSQIFNNETIEGSNEQFILNLNKSSSVTISSINLIYNGTSYSSTLNLNGNIVTATNEITIPGFTTVSNISFYWNILLTNGDRFNSSFNNQTVNILNIDNCSSFSSLLYNYTLRDEETQNKLTNSSIEVSVNVYDLSGRILVINFSQEFTNVNPVTICLNTILTNSTNYSLDSIVKYTSNESVVNDSIPYAIEYYNILNFTLSNSTIPQVINLYPLKEEDSTEFQLTFRDSSLALAPNILVHVDRQYISDNDFKTVELPLTDSNGQTVLHLVRNDVIYNLIMINKNGEIIATFNKVTAFCDDFTIGDCTLNLNAGSVSEQVYDYNNDVKVTYSLEFDNDTNILTLNFISTDGLNKDMNLVVTRTNDFGNRSVCNEVLTASSGVLTCNVSSIIDTSRYVYVEVNANNELIETLTTDLLQEQNNWGVNGFFLAFLMILFVITLFMEDKQTLIISLVVGWVCCLGLGLINGAIVGSASSGIWLIVIAIIYLWKLNSEELF